MIKNAVQTAVIVAAACCMISSAACSRSEQKMKVPDIKMITRENLHCVIAPDDNNIWVTGAFGTIYHSSDGGRNWAPQNSGESQTTLCSGVFLDSRTGWVVGYSSIRVAHCLVAWKARQAAEKRVASAIARYET